MTPDTWIRITEIILVIILIPIIKGGINVGIELRDATRALTAVTETLQRELIEVRRRIEDHEDRLRTAERSWINRIIGGEHREDK